MDHRLDPYQIIEINSDWVVRSEDGEKLGISHEQFIAISIQAIKEQQELIKNQTLLIQSLQENQKRMQNKLVIIDKQLNNVIKSDNTPEIAGSK